MRCLIAVSAPGWTNRSIHIEGARSEQMRRSALAAALRDLADRIQNGGLPAGDLTFERPGMVLSARVELPGSVADAA